MKKYYLQTQTFIFLILLFFDTSCYGQVNSNFPKDSVSEQKTIFIGQSKIIKPQGTSEYDNIHCGVQDDSDNLWFGTTGEGVYRYDGESFTQFTVKDGLSNNFIWCIYKDKASNIWFGTSDGVCFYDGTKFNSISITTTNDSNYFTNNSPNNKLSLNSNDVPSEEKTVWSILQDKSGKFWFGTSNGIYNYNGKTFTHFLHNDGIINNSGHNISKIESILEDKTGNIWFGGRGTEGLFRFDGKSLTSFTPDGKEWVRPILEDKSGNIWFGNRNHSVYCYDGKTFVNFEDEKLYGWVVSIAEDKEGNLWFSTQRGVAKFDGKNITTFATNDGLSNIDIFYVTIDKSGKLWVGTRSLGLYRYDGKTFTSFSE